jgi:outer membrane protein
MAMRLRGRRLAATFSASVIALAATAASAETLADAIALAYQSNPNLLAAQATQRALDETYVQARTGWRPTLNLQAQASYDETRIPRLARVSPLQLTITETRQGAATLTLTQPIWTGGRVGAAVSAAHADVLAGRENLRRVEAQVLASVIVGYMDVRRDQESLAIHQADLLVLQKQLDESQARFDVGELTRTDVALSQARLAASQAQLQSAQAQLAVSRAEYAAAVGQNPGELAPEPSLAYLLPADADAAYDVAEKFNPALRGQEFAADASRARLAQARAGRAPTISAQATVNTTGPVDPFVQERYDREFRATVGVSVPLFSGGLVTSQIRQQVERNNSDRIAIETQRRSVLQTITGAWNQLIANRANITSTQEQVNAALIAAEGTRQELAVGLRTTIDVLNAEQELRAAQLSQIGAVHDAYISSVSLLSAMGRLEARNLIPTVPQYDAQRNFRKLRFTWGWVPWEEPIGVVDSVLTPRSHEKPEEPAFRPGLEPTPVPILAPGKTAPN